MTYRGTDGLEEMHVFFAMAWFDLGSWAWMHYVNEWGTKGTFMVSTIVCSRSRGDEASDVDAGADDGIPPYLFAGGKYGGQVVHDVRLLALLY